MRMAVTQIKVIALLTMLDGKFATVREMADVICDADKIETGKKDIKRILSKLKAKGIVERGADRFYSDGHWGATWRIRK